MSTIRRCASRSTPAPAALLVWCDAQGTADWPVVAATAAAAAARDAADAMLPKPALLNFSEGKALPPPPPARVMGTAATVLVPTRPGLTPAAALAPAGAAAAASETGAGAVDAGAGARSAAAGVGASDGSAAGDGAGADADADTAPGLLDRAATCPDPAAAPSPDPDPTYCGWLGDMNTSVPYDCPTAIMPGPWPPPALPGAATIPLPCKGLGPRELPPAGPCWAWPDPAVMVMLL